MFITETTAGSTVAGLVNSANTDVIVFELNIALNCEQTSLDVAATTHSHNLHSYQHLTTNIRNEVTCEKVND